MNDKVKQWGIIGGVSLLTISLIYLFSKPKKQKSSPFKKKLVNLANEEWDKWVVIASSLLNELKQVIGEEG